MPLKKEDAERVLELLWEFGAVATAGDEEKDEEKKKDKEAFLQAISMLQVYLTDILPTTQPSLRVAVGNSAVNIPLTSQARPQLVKIACRGQQKLGVEIQKVEESTVAGNFHRFFVSRIEEGSAASTRLRVGDIVMEINNRPLTDVTLDRARWLLKKAARSHEVSLLIISSDERAASRKKRPVTEPVRVVADVHDVPNLRLSDNHLHVKNKTPLKITLHLERSKGWGVKLVEGSKSLIEGVAGIFVAEVDKDKPAGREGSLVKGDEVLMVNHRSVAGLTKQEVVQIVRSSSPSVHFLIAREKHGLKSSSSILLESIEIPEAEKLVAFNGARQQKKPPKIVIPSSIAAVALSEGSPTVRDQKTTSYSGNDIELREISLQADGARIRQRHASDQTGYTTTQLIEQTGSSSPAIAQLAEKPLTQWGRLSTSSIHTTPPQPSEKTVVFVKENRPLGFTLCGGKGSKWGDIGIFIRRIQPGGLAHEDGRVREGDELLEVNEKPLTDCTHKMAANMIKELTGVVALKLKSGPGYLSIPKKPKRTSSVKGTSLTVVIELNEGEPLGLQIAGLTDNRDEYGIFISEIVADSPAEKCKLLRVSDQLTEVNQQSLLDMPVGEAEAILATIPAGKVKLQVIRPRSVDALGQLLADKDTQSLGSRGSFRMCAAKQTEEEPINEEEPPPPVTSLLDRDIIELFTPSESGSQENLNQNPLSNDGDKEDAASQFPSLMNALETTNEDDQDSILASMTPILTRPSIAVSISRSSSLRETETAQSLDEETGEIQKQQQRQSGLFISHTAEDNQQTGEKASVMDEESLLADETPPPIPPTAAPPPPPPLEDDVETNEEQFPTQLMSEGEEQPPAGPPSSPIHDMESSQPVESVPDYAFSSDEPPSLPAEAPPSLPADAPLSLPNEENTPSILHEISAPTSAPPDLPEDLSQLDLQEEPPQLPEDNPPDLHEEPPQLPEDNPPDLYEEPPQLPQDNPPDLYEEPPQLPQDYPPDLYEEPPQLPEDNPPDLHEEPPQLPQDYPPDLYEEPPQLPQDNPPDLQDELPQLPENNPPDLEEADEPPSVPTESPPTLPDSPPPPTIHDNLAPQPAQSPKTHNHTPPSPKRLIPTPPPPYQSVSSTQPKPDKPHAPSPAPVPKERGQEGDIYEVEVKKGLLGLGIKLTTNESGLVIVKTLSSSSPLTKDGTMRLGDILMSVDGKETARLTVSKAESVIKAVPRGSLVKITAMVPRKHRPMKEEVPKIVTPPAAGRDEEEGVVTVKLVRKKDSPLGIEIEGGSDTSLQNVYITSIAPDSTAAKNGQLKMGDQIIMCGEKCLIGITSVEAWHILKEAPMKVEITVARKNESQTLNFRGSNTDLTKPSGPVADASLPPMRSRVTSSSLHFASLTPSTSQSGLHELSRHSSTEDMRDDTARMRTIVTPPPPPAAVPELTPVKSHKSFIIVLRRHDKTPFGFSVKGGADKPELPHVYIKTVQPEGIAAADGRLRKGDQLLEVNNVKLEGMTHQDAVGLLKKSGDTLTLVVTRRVSSKARVRRSSKSSQSGSGESSQSSASPSPIISRSVSRKRLSVNEKVYSGIDTQAIKVVELHKGPTGLGIHLSGSVTPNTKVPISIKEILPGGAAYKSGKISIGDVIIEANNIPFQGLTMSEAMKTVKALPQGTVRIVLIDARHANDL